MLYIRKLAPAAELPTRAYEDSAALDLSAFLQSERSHTFVLTIAPNSTRLIGTGLAMRPPSGHLILVCSRSGLATRSVFVANAPGVVDPDYTGEIKVALFNGGSEPHYVHHGDRIAQILLTPYLPVELRTVDVLPPTERGERGFGSTGA